MGIKSPQLSCNLGTQSTSQPSEPRDKWQVRDGTFGSALALTSHSTCQTAAAARAAASLRRKETGTPGTVFTAPGASH